MIEQGFGGVSRKATKTDVIGQKPTTAARDINRGNQNGVFSRTGSRSQSRFSKPHRLPLDRKRGIAVGLPLLTTRLLEPPPAWVGAGRGAERTRSHHGNHLRPGTLGDMFAEPSRETRTLVQQELQLAKTERTEKASEIGG